MHNIIMVMFAVWLRVHYGIMQPTSSRGYYSTGGAIFC